MNTILDKIVAAKKEELKEIKSKRPLDELKAMVGSMPEARDFASALKRGGNREISIIAEVKKASPSKGVICKDFSPLKIAMQYQACGAAAVSVLTEKNYFMGSLENLHEISRAVHVPVLRKDFIFDQYQVYESKANGADAILLIAGILLNNNLKELLQLSKYISLYHIVEVHTQDELMRAIASGADVIGINNRDLNTFKTDVRTTLHLIKKIPPGKIIVSESGISSRADIMKLAEAGVDAFLIGELLMKDKNPGLKLKELIGNS